MENRKDAIQGLSRELEEIMWETNPVTANAHTERHPLVTQAWKLTAVCFSLTIAALVVGLSS